MRELLIALAIFASDMLGRLRHWLTFRRLLGLVALLILVLCLKGLIVDLGMGADAFAFFAIDWGLALEVSALMVVEIIGNPARLRIVSESITALSILFNCAKASARIRYCSASRNTTLYS